MLELYLLCLLSEDLLGCVEADVFHELRILVVGEEGRLVFSSDCVKALLKT